MKKIIILTLHLKHGGIQKQITTLANVLCNDYNIEIVSVYRYNNIAYKLDNRIKIKYLISSGPTKKEFLEVLKKCKFLKVLTEGWKNFKVIAVRDQKIKSYIKDLDCDLIISDRLSIAKILGKYGSKDIVKCTQEHNHIDTPKYTKKVQKNMKHLDCLIVMSSQASDNYRGWLKGNKKIKIVTIPNILSKIPQETSSSLGKKLIAVGRLDPVKRFDILLDVFKMVLEKHSDATLTIVGGGIEEARLKNKAKKLKIDGKVTFTGMIDFKKVESKMLESSIYLMTSKTECFPMVLLEANACGIPTIAFDVPVGPRATIVPSKTGILVKEGELKKMSDEICKLLEDKKRLRIMSKNAKKHSYKFLANKIISQWISFIEGEINEKRKQ